MTRHKGQPVLAQRWRPAVLVLVLVALTGVAIILWARIDRADTRADALADEANLRGTAVSTLAGNVRELRAQIEAEGETPVVPDPSEAIQDLPDRAEVPVPIPGPRGPSGEKGEKGAPGKPAPTLTPRPGQDGRDGTNGVDGAPGADSTVPGPSGPEGPVGPMGPEGQQGQRGEQGEKGATGPPGPACPDGFSLQAPSWDPDALVCRRDGADPVRHKPASNAPALLAIYRREDI